MREGEKGRKRLRGRESKHPISFRAKFLNPRFE